MNWKYIKRGVLVILSLVIIIPMVLYLRAIDWSKKHSSRVAALPLYSDTEDEGEFRLEANHMEFLIRVAGMQNDGKGIILLHGFPESSLMWQPLLDKASSEGFRVLAFDQRGYSPKARPKDVEAYQVNHLVEDVLAIADKVGFDTFHLVGHDWGAAVGWKTVMDFPERIDTWTAMAIPHSGVFFDAVLNHPEQQKRSGYMKRFQTPILPEFLFHLSRNKVADNLRGKWTDEQIEECLAIQSEYGATTAALNWYRASWNGNNESLKKNVSRPTLFIWGKKDQVIAPQIIPQQKSYIKAPYQELALDTGHNLMQSKQDSIIKAILSHISK